MVRVTPATFATVHGDLQEFVRMSNVLPPTHPPRVKRISQPLPCHIRRVASPDLRWSGVHEAVDP